MFRPWHLSVVILALTGLYIYSMEYLWDETVVLPLWKCALIACVLIHAVANTQRTTPAIVDLTRTYQRQQRGRLAGDLPAVYPNGWFRVSYSGDVTAGRLHSLSFLGRSLVLFRQSTGQIAAIDAYCPHLGAHLGGGTLHRDVVECPFHGWRFNATGACVHIPYCESIPSEARVTTYAVRECDTLVLVWFDAEGRPPLWEPQSVFGGRSFTQRGRVEHHIPCHIQDIPENGCDIAHFNHLHKRGVLLPSLVGHSWDATWEPDTAQPHCTNICYKASWVVLGRRLSFGTVTSRIRQVGPGLVQIHFSVPLLGGVWLLESVTPVGPLHQQVDHVMFAERLVPTFVAKFFLDASIAQFELDGPIWSQKTHQRKPVLVKGDGRIMQFRRWYSQFYSEHSPTLAEARCVCCVGAAFGAVRASDALFRYAH